LVLRPEVLLLDEPLSNLDAKLRVQLRWELRALQQRLGMTFVYVTHDQDEALSLSDWIAVMNAGRVEQAGAPWDIYYHPKKAFLGDLMRYWVTVDGREWIVDQPDPGARQLFDGDVLISIRPERVHLIAEVAT